MVNGDWSVTDTPDDASKIGTGAIKYDNGKPAVFQGVIEYFPRALWAVAEVSTFGSKKYAWNGWSDVDDGFKRYKDAQFRHTLKQAMGEEVDDDSKLDHLAHEAWGALATLELYLRQNLNNKDRYEIKEDERQGGTRDLHGDVRDTCLCND